MRPGPIIGGAVHPYIEHRKRLRADPAYEVPYLHPSLEPVLRDTLGTIVFQDQVLEVAMEFAGFRPGEAEGLRRAMSRKRSEAAIRAYEQKFIAGGVERGATREVAEQVWSQIVGFSGFGFPRRTRQPSGCSPTNRPGCACTTTQSSCARSERAADGVLST